MDKENFLKIDFTKDKKEFKYNGSLGDLISNTLTLIHNLYISLKDNQKEIYKEAIIKAVNNAIMFMNDEEIENTIKKINGENNE